MDYDEKVERGIARSTSFSSQGPILFQYRVVKENADDAYSTSCRPPNSKFSPKSLMTVCGTDLDGVPHHFGPTPMFPSPPTARWSKTSRRQFLFLEIFSKVEDVPTKQHMPVPSFIGGGRKRIHPLPYADLSLPYPVRKDGFQAEDAGVLATFDFRLECLNILTILGFLWAFAPLA
uniref:Uncharacterized protein n=1 Tax=Aegilops tauschii TaxID=37682 RepID=R7W4Z8_AEGTA